jgi:hypothetical protein
MGLYLNEKLAATPTLAQMKQQYESYRFMLLIPGWRPIYTQMRGVNLVMFQ